MGELFREKKLKRCYHFVGIGGIGMGALASLMLDKGFCVTGSDIKESAMVKSLRSKGARVFIGHESQNIREADFVVYSSAINPSNAEFKEAIKREIPILKRAQLLAEFMQDYTSVTVAGAHGKTTTSSLASSLLHKAGLKPTTAVGGIVNDIQTNAHLGQGDYFVAEVDESDGTFLHFNPDVSIITNIDKEHLDFYQSWEGVLEAYQCFLKKTKKDGLIIGCGDDPNLLRLLKESKRAFQTYGFDSSNDYYACNVEQFSHATEFDVYGSGKKIGRFQSALPGRHNVLNSLAIIALGFRMDIDLVVIKHTLAVFKGVQRRFQVLADLDQIKVVDDYAHHPTEIKSVLQTAREMNPKRLVSVFQPHRYSRLQALFDEFSDSFSDSDYIILTDIYSANETAIAGVTIEKLKEAIALKTQVTIEYVPKEKLVDHLVEIVKKGDMLITLGAGDITSMAHAFADRISQPMNIILEDHKV